MGSISANLTEFSEDDILSCFYDEFEKATKRYESVGCPRAVLLAGQPGAGKTQLSTMARASLNRNAVLVNGDNYRRYHPHYRELYKAFGSEFVGMISPFSNEVSNRLIEACSDKRLNLIIEGTGRTVKVPKDTAEKLAAKGYTIEMAVIAARPVVSLISTLLRFYDMNKGGTIPRSTAVEAHDKVVRELPDNLDVLVAVPEISRLMIWDREPSCIFDSSHDSVLPSEVLKGYWYAEWRDDEIEAARRDISKLEALERQYCLWQAPVIAELKRRFELEVCKHQQCFEQTFLS